MINNPMGTDGFEFLEFCAPDPSLLEEKFRKLGFTHVANHRSKAVKLFQQGECNFVVNAQANTVASDYAQQHGPSTCAMGFRVKDANLAFEKAVASGAEPFRSPINDGECEIPAIYGIGGSLIYFVDRYGSNDIYEIDFEFIHDANPKGCGLSFIDHVTHNVRQGNMDKWAGFYEKHFNFREIRYFDIQGKLTGLVSRALTSPCGKIKIPINEATDDQSQIEEFIRDYHGEGIQHIALSTENIYQSVEDLRSQPVVFLDVPDTYYEMIADRVPWHREDLSALQKHKILLDGDKKEEDGGLLLQIFTENTMGPVFFEVIQRKGNEGFGEGNFQALFESIERDQMRRGTLKAND